MTAKKFLQEKGIHPTEPIYWDLKDTTISLEELMQEYTDKQLSIPLVSNNEAAGCRYCKQPVSINGKCTNVACGNWLGKG